MTEPKQMKERNLQLRDTCLLETSSPSQITEAKILLQEKYFPEIRRIRK